MVDELAVGPAPSAEIGDVLLRLAETGSADIDLAE